MLSLMMSRRHRGTHYNWQHISTVLSVIIKKRTGPRLRRNVMKLLAWIKTARKLCLDVDRYIFFSRLSIETDQDWMVLLSLIG